MSPEAIQAVHKATGYIPRKPAAVPLRNYSLGLTGMHLGGLTGLSALGKLQIDTSIPLTPYIDGAIGLSGARYGIGLLWEFDGGSRYHVSSHGVSVLRYDTHAAVSARFVIIHRWQDDTDRWDAWHGKDVPDSKYLGGEFDIIIIGACFTPGIYRSMDSGEHYGAVSYGFGF